MKVTDKMFEEMIKITKLMSKIKQCIEAKNPYKDIDSKRLNIYYKLQKQYNWSNQRLRNFNSLARELSGLATMTIILYKINNEDIVLTDELRENILKDFFDHVTIDMLEKDTF